MDRQAILRGERPVNPLEYQQPLREELYARVRDLERENKILRVEVERLYKVPRLPRGLRWLAGS